MKELFKKIISFDSIDSTNVYGLENIEELEHKTIIITNTQTQGKGRFDRKWQSSNPDNLYFSIILKPNNKEHIANFTQYMSFCIAKTISKYGIIPNIKWPNDVRIKDRKIAGILAKSAFKKGKMAGIVLGVGINLNSSQVEIAKIDQLATSLNLELGEDINKEDFLLKLSQEFFQGYDEFVEKGFVSIKKEYEAYFELMNKEIIVKNWNDTKKGIVMKINDDGTLFLLDNSQNIIKITIGDILC